MSVIGWYRRRSSATKRRLESVWETGLVVFVAYLSPYIASPKGVLFDRAFVTVVVALSLTLYIKLKRDPKIRHSGNRLLTLVNRSIAWSFGVFLGALSPALPALFGLTLQYPYAVVVVSGGLLLFAFEQIGINKENDELIKPESVNETSLAKEKRITLRLWISDAAKRVKQFGEKHPRLSVFILAILVGLVVIYFSSGDDRQTITTTAQSVIELASFLAGASGVLTAIYLTQILTGIPKSVRKSIPNLKDMIAQSVASTVGSATNPEELVQLAQKGMNSGIENWKSFVKGQMSGARRIRNVGSYALIILVGSAIGSVLAILSGSALLLGVSVFLMIIAAWTIFRSWKVAEESIEDLLFVSNLVG